MKTPVCWSWILALTMASSAQAQNVLAQIPIASNSVGQITVDAAINLIYDAGSFNGGGNRLTVISGETLSVSRSFSPAGGAAVDIKNDNYWTGNLSGGDVLVYSTASPRPLASVPLSGCPGQVNFDCNRRRMWVTAQCGGGNDPAWVLNADSFAVIEGPIGSGGVMGWATTNPNTGKLYLTASGVPKEIDPNTFAVTNTTFGTVYAVDTVANQLYAVQGTTLQIVDGETETILKSVALSYTPAGVGINNALRHVYTSNPASTIEVRNSASGNLVATFSLGANFSPQGMAVDSTRGRIYVNVYNASTSQWFLYVIEDLSSTRTCLALGGC